MAHSDTAIRNESLRADLRSHIGRFADKQPDWDAFPSNRGYPELARAQIRYVGAGGSPKVSDPSTLKAEHFTLSLVHLPAGNYAASHVHDVEEAFFVVKGVLTVASDYDGKIVKSRMGPRDMLLNEPGRPHGFLNDGVEPVLMAIMVGNIEDKPVAIRYKCHPKDVGPEVARTFGGVEDTSRHDVDRWITRYSQAKAEKDPSGIARMTYIGSGGAPAGRFTKDLVHVPAGCSVSASTRDVEDAFFVMSGYLTVGWEADGAVVEERLGPRDAVFNPAGRAHYFRNDGIEDAEFLMIVGSPEPDSMRFEA
jgi:mannose-6-phosphate isomerase-like protein (cupin superfamily)